MAELFARHAHAVDVCGSGCAGARPPFPQSESAIIFFRIFAASENARRCSDFPILSMIKFIATMDFVPFHWVSFPALRSHFFHLPLHLLFPSVQQTTENDTNTWKFNQLVSKIHFPSRSRRRSAAAESSGRACKRTHSRPNTISNIYSNRTEMYEPFKSKAEKLSARPRNSERKAETKFGNL